MTDPLQKALDSLQRTISRKTKKAVVVSSIEEKEKDLFKAQVPDPSPREQQDLMAFPFFSLSKNKRTEPIEYEQGNVKVRECPGLTHEILKSIYNQCLILTSRIAFDDVRC